MPASSRVARLRGHNGNLRPRKSLEEILHRLPEKMSEEIRCKGCRLYDCLQVDNPGSTCAHGAVDVRTRRSPGNRVAYPELTLLGPIQLPQILLVELQRVHKKQNHICRRYLKTPVIGERTI